jgi:uncharacterized membrane protein YgcG
MHRSGHALRTPITDSGTLPGTLAPSVGTSWSRRDLLRFSLAATILGALPGCAFTRATRLGFGEEGLQKIPAGRYTVTLFEPPARGFAATFLYVLAPPGQGKTDLDQLHGVRPLGDKSLDEILALVKAQPLKSIEEPMVEAVIHHSGKIAGYLISHGLDCTVQVSDQGDLAVRVKDLPGGGPGGSDGGSGGGSGSGGGGGGGGGSGGR